MLTSRFAVNVIVCFGLLAACSPALPPTEAAAPATLAPPPSAILADTATPAPTATLVLPVAAGTAIPALSEVLSAANIPGIIEVARWGGGQVSDAAYSPDGKSVAVATTLGVSIFEADTLAKKMSLETKSPVNAFAFSPDGTALVTGMRDNSVATWNTADGTLLKSYEGKKKVITDPKRAKEQVTAVAFSEDGSLVAAGSSEGFVNVWKVSDGSVTQTFTSHVLDIARLFFSTDGKSVFSASSDGTVRLTQLSDGQLLRGYGGQSLRDAAISRDGKTLATVDTATYYSAAFLVLWDVETRKELRRIKAGDYKANVRSLAFSPDGQSIGTGWSDYSVKVYSVSDGSLLGSSEQLKPTAQLAKDWWWVVNPQVGYSPDGKMLMWAGDDSAALLTPDGTKLLKRQVIGTRQMYGIALSPDGQTLASSEGTDVHLRHFADGSLYPEQSQMKSLGNVAFAPDGNFIAGGFVDEAAEHSAIMLWPVTSQGSAKTFDTSLSFAWSLAAFPPDGKTVALGVAAEIVFYDISDGTLVKTIHSGLGSDFSDLAFSADGTMLAVSQGKNTNLKQVKDGKSLKSYNGGSAVAFSPDSTLLAGSDWDKNVRVWKVPTDQVVVTMADNADYVYSLRFSNDGTLLVGGLSDGTITVWSMPDGAVLKTWQAHSRGVSSLIFSPDGKELISSSYDGTIRVWGLKP